MTTNWKELVGKRVLVKGKTDTLHEATVLSVSDVCGAVALQSKGCGVFWYQPTEWEVQDVLPDLEQPKPKSAETPRQPGLTYKVDLSGTDRLNWALNDLSRRARHQRMGDLQRELSRLRRLDRKEREPKPDSEWSFKALPKDTDLRRILSEADQAGARAVGVVLCGQSFVAMRRGVIGNSIGKAEVGPRMFGGDPEFVTTEWQVYSVKSDPFSVARQALAELDKWAARKHRTTVSVWK